MEGQRHGASGAGDERVPRREHRAEDVRQGRIVLRRTWQRVVFFGGLVLGVLLALIFGR